MKKVLDIWTTILWYITAVLVFATVVVVCMQIIWRYVLSDPLTWTEQIGRYLFIWICMTAIPVGLYRTGLYNFDLLLSKLKGKSALIVKSINAFACLAFSGYYFYQALLLCIKGGWRFAQGVHIKMICLYIAQPICAASMFVIFLYQYINVVKEYRASKQIGGEK